MIHPRANAAIDNICVKKYPDPTCQSIYGPDKDFGLMCTNLDLGGMTFGQGHDTPLDNGQELRELLSISNV